MSIFDPFNMKKERDAAEAKQRQQMADMLNKYYDQILQQSYLQQAQALGGYGGNRQANQALYSGAHQAWDPFNQRAVLASPAPGRAEQSAACPHQGIRAGEIIAYRSWKVAEGELRSTYTNFKWMPGPLECVGGTKKLAEGYGFFAYRDEGRARSEAMNEMQSVMFAVGSIYLWGEIVEHETGYRASHAAIKSIDFVNPLNDQLLERLRAAYVIAPKPLEEAA